MRNIQFSINANDKNKYSNDMKAETYQLFLDVEIGNLTPEQAQSELLDLLSVSHRTSPDTYSGADLHKVPFGLYEIFWKSGGSSLASVGNMHDGVRWIAPINWTSENSPTGRMDKHADSIERMVLLYGG
jgi:hypothetical protein